MPPAVTLQDVPQRDRFPYAAATYEYNGAPNLPVGDLHRLLASWKKRMAEKAIDNLAA
jgi:hypothetical protein